MSPALRKFVLTVHVTSSVGLLGAIVCFLALAVAGLITQNATMVHATYPAMNLITRFVIVPLAFASLMVGVMQGLGTKWGLFRHWWVLVKLLLTLLAIVILLLQMELISYLARAVTEATFSGAELGNERRSMVVHAGGGLLVLLVAMVLSVYKPKGLTRYGARRLAQPQGRYRSAED